MYAKLAWRNLRRSLADYGIYFMTLVFAVAIFYVFNSVSDQPAFLSLAESQRRMARGAVETMEWLTTIMTGVVAWLVFYANRVIVRKRSRELGTYMLLGMEQGRLALLLLAEVAAIGAVALGVGLALGVALSQVFGLLVEQVFRAPVDQRGFVYSARAAGWTLILYGAMFLALALWQAAAVYRQRLIELIHGARKNEEIRLRSRPLALTAGLLAAGTLGTAYWLADRVSRTTGLDPTDPRVSLGFLLGVAGTYLLFASLAGLLTVVRRRTGGWLARGLNLFLYRQVTSKINTHAVMLATVALMLTFTICAMSTGLGLGAAIRGGLESDMPFSYMASSSDPDQDYSGLRALLAQHGVADAQVVEFVAGYTGLEGADLMLPDDAERFLSDEEGGYTVYVPVRAMPYSAYGRLRALKGYRDVPATPDGYLLHAADRGHEAAARTHAAWERFVAAGSAVEVVGVALRPAAAEVFSEPLGYQLGGISPVLVVPDPVMAALAPDEERSFSRYLVAELPGQDPPGLAEAASAWALEQSQGQVWVHVSSRAEALGSVYMIEGILVFLSFYAGIMFILISATLLALHQVTDALEHQQRFAVLQKLGVDDAMLNGVIARQVGLYFLTPVLVAFVHSGAALVALNRALTREAGYETVGQAALTTLAIFAAIYGAYYLLSVQSCRSLFRPGRAG
ncbi:FtsX-like permease family protein [Symbiobacterium terraclitae]|uniref:FtsX-like permease family protein n=1 Tax=Symbiobacterium terraclitae TaxID=557451 RepID=UPI0035B52305